MHLWTSPAFSNSPLYPAAWESSWDIQAKSRPSTGFSPPLHKPRWLPTAHSHLPAPIFQHHLHVSCSEVVPALQIQHGKSLPDPGLPPLQLDLHSRQRICQLPLQQIVPELSQLASWFLCLLAGRLWSCCKPFFKYVLNVSVASHSHPTARLGNLKYL